MIADQIYLNPAASVAKEIGRSASLSLRSNRTIDRALRQAYGKYDRSKQTQSLLQRYLLR